MRSSPAPSSSSVAAALAPALHPHPAHILLPLLRAHLPHSIAVYGTILANASGTDAGASHGTSEALESETATARWVYTTFAPSEIPRLLAEAEAAGQPHNLGADDGRGLVLSQSEGSDVHAAHADSNSHDDIWTAIIPLPPPLSHHTRTYCSAERYLPSTTSGDLPAPILAYARAQVLRATAAYLLTVDPSFQVAGCLHVACAGALEAAWGLGGAGAVVDEDADREQVKEAEVVHRGSDAEKRARREPRPRCWVMLAPEGYPGVSPDDGGDGYVLDTGREEDVQSFVLNTDIDRTPAYYASRLPQSTILRSSSTSASNTSPGAPAAQVLTHSDGALGALYTASEHRRRGLGARVVRAHMRGAGRWGGAGAGEGDESMPGVGWTHVYTGNAASCALFEREGWGRAWEVAWVYRP